MGTIAVHEFIALDGVFENPSWTADFDVSGSGTLVRALLTDGLVDHLHLFLYPVAVGSGQRLWGDGVDTTRLRLADSDVYANGVVHLDYGRA